MATLLSGTIYNTSDYFSNPASEFSLTYRTTRSGSELIGRYYWSGKLFLGSEPEDKMYEEVTGVMRVRPTAVD